MIYKKITFLATLLCVFTQYASDATTWLEIKSSYFVFSEAPMSDIYHKGGFEIQGSASVPVHHHLDLYSSIGYRKAWGHALTTCEKTSITTTLVDIGIKPILQCSENVYYFLAIGPRYFHFHQYNNSPHIRHLLNDNHIGFFTNTGFNMLLTKHLLLGIFGEYSYEKKSVCSNMPNVFSNDSPVQTGGFALGISLGYAF